MEVIADEVEDVVEEDDDEEEDDDKLNFCEIADSSWSVLSSLC